MCVIDLTCPHAIIVTQPYTYIRKQRIFGHDNMTCPSVKHHAKNNCDYSTKMCYLTNHE